MVPSTLLHEYFIVIFLSQSFKPVDCRIIVAPFREDFEKLFCQTFSRKKNIQFLKHIQVRVCSFGLMVNHTFNFLNLTATQWIG